MNPVETLDTLDRATALFEAAFGHPNGATPDPARVADALHVAFPAALSCACWLTDPGGGSAAVLDREGQPCPDLEERLAAPARPDEDLAARWAALLGGPKRAVAVALVAAEGRQGALALAVAGGPAEAALPRLWLRNAARTLSLALSAGAARRAAVALEEEARSLDRLAHVGELAGPLAHEFSNFLNVLLLQVMVMEYQLPEAHRADLAEIRRQGHLANELIGRFHQHRRAPQPPARPVELPRLAAEVADELRRDPDSDSVGVELAAAGPGCLVQAPVADLKRLLRFLIRNAARAAAHGGGLVRVEAAADPAGGVRLRVEDNGPPLDAEAASRVFEAATPGRAGVEPLELAACQSLVRRLGGRIQAEERPGGGLRLEVAFPAPRA